MPVPKWPSAIPACVLRDQWAMEPVSPLKRTEMDDGSVAVTRRFARIRVNLPVAWLFSVAAFEVFKDFWARDLDAGQRYFDAPVSLGRSACCRRVRFAGAEGAPWRATSPVSGWIVVTSMLEMEDMPVLTDAERDGYATTLEYFGGVDEVEAELRRSRDLLNQFRDVI